MEKEEPIEQESTPPEVAPSEAPPHQAPAYVTKEDLQASGNEMATQLAAALRPAAPQADVDWEQAFANRAADAATARLLEVNKPIFAAGIADQVAGEFGIDVKREVQAELQKLPGHVVASITQSPDDLKRLARMARGIHAERQAAQAPRSGGSGTVGAATSEENRLADKFWNDYKDIPGFTKDDARAMAKERI